RGDTGSAGDAAHRYADRGRLLPARRHSALRAAAVDHVALMGNEQTLRLHRDATVLLGYSNPARRFLSDRVDFTWFAEDDPAVQGSLPRLREGGVDAVVLSFGLPIEPLGPVGSGHEPRTVPAWGPVFHGAEQVKYMLHCLDSLRNTLEAHADQVEV